MIFNNIFVKKNFFFFKLFLITKMFLTKYLHTYFTCFSLFIMLIAIIDKFLFYLLSINKKCYINITKKVILSKNVFNP